MYGGSRIIIRERQGWVCCSISLNVIYPIIVVVFRFDIAGTISPYLTCLYGHTGMRETGRYEIETTLFHFRFVRFAFDRDWILHPLLHPSAHIIRL